MGWHGLKAVELIILQIFLEDVFDPLVCVELKTDGPFARFVKTLPVIFSGKAQDSHTDLVCLFRVFAALKDMGDDVFYMFAGIPRPVNEPLRIPVTDELVMRGHMIGIGCVSARPAVSLMEGDTSVFMEYLDSRMRV